MKRDSLEVLSGADQSCLSNEGRVSASSNAISRKAGERSKTRNWAWAHTAESYDWMDWHSPSSTGEFYQ